MKLKSLKVAAAAVALFACHGAFADLGVGVKAGTLGLGVEARWDPLVPWFDLRVGLQEERARSHEYGGRSVFGDATPSPSLTAARRP